MKSLKPILIGALSAIVVFGGMQVASAVTSNKEIKACANKRTGIMRYTKKSCRKNETKLVFNSQGVQGPQGAVGQTGATGATGATGESGASTNSQVKNICGADGASPCVFGAIGPAGGTVFITPETSGNTSGLYYEAAPATWYQGSGDISSGWCHRTNELLGVTFSSLTGNGPMVGAHNTAIMLGICATGAAVFAGAEDITVRGVTYADWFLPSKGELYRMSLSSSLAATFVDGNYWTSNEYSSTHAWVHNPVTNSDNQIAKSGSAYIRPIRAF